VDIFDFTDNKWATAELSKTRDGIAAIGAGSKIFFAGGVDDNRLYKIVDVYDVATNMWSVSQLSRETDAPAAATVGNKVFFAGGNLGIYAVSTVDIYDLTTNTWSTASLSTPRNFITTASANNKVYFTGGDPWTEPTSNVIDIYDNNTGAWSTSIMQVPRGYHAAIAVNDILYLAGGKTSQSGDPICSVETLSTKTGTRTLMNLSSPTAGQNAMVKNNKIVFPKNDGGANSDKIDVYDISSNSWSIGVLLYKFDGASFIAANNTIYVAGGLVNRVLSDKVYRMEF
jgi:hypothetical protein